METQGVAWTSGGGCSFLRGCRIAAEVDVVVDLAVATVVAFVLVVVVVTVVVVVLMVDTEATDVSLVSAERARLRVVLVSAAII